MAKPKHEKRVSCPACGQGFPVDELRQHLAKCPMMAQFDEEMPLRGRNLAKWAEKP